MGWGLKRVEKDDDALGVLSPTNTTISIVNVVSIVLSWTYEGDTPKMLREIDWVIKQRDDIFILEDGD